MNVQLEMSNLGLDLEKALKKQRCRVRRFCLQTRQILKLKAGNTKRGSITVSLTSCLTGLESAV